MSRRAENKSQLTGWLKDATLANFRARNENRAALSAVRAFVDDPRAWLTLWGEYGNGKSHLLGAVVNACSEADIPAAYYTLPDLLDQVRESFDGYYSPFMQRLRDLPVLAIDEIDKANLTPWAEEKIYQLVDARYRAIGSCGTVLAMNADPANAGSNSAAYIFSRMFDERSKVVELRGPDARPMAKRLWSALRMAA